MSRARDPGALLMRALQRDAGAAGCTVTLEAARSTPWASATFVGERHAWQIGGGDADADDGIGRWLARLPDTDFAVPGHLLADLAVTRRGATVTIEALTVEAA